jgi:hypothetical protein
LEWVEESQPGVVVLQRGRRNLRRASRVVALVLAGTALCTSAARSQNATWLTSPTTGDFDTGSNWTTATVPTGTAFFGTSTVTNLTFSAAGTTIGGWTFNAGASNYAFTIPSPQALTFNGAGIVINGGSATVTNNFDLSLSMPTVQPAVPSSLTIAPRTSASTTPAQPGLPPSQITAAPWAFSTLARPARPPSTTMSSGRSTSTAPARPAAPPSITTAAPPLCISTTPAALATPPLTTARWR